VLHYLSLTSLATSEEREGGTYVSYFHLVDSCSPHARGEAQEEDLLHQARSFDE
jgi:hypothetical protein